MCYSVESSAKTSLLSLVAIILLFTSNVPHFKWIAMILVGWCGMQFAEMLLWLTNPRKSCTTANKILTLTLIPLILLMQPLGSILGSFFVKPWAQCSQQRKLFIVVFSAIVSTLMLVFFYTNTEKYCTTVTPEGHLHWWLSVYKTNMNARYILYYYLWLFIISFPIFMLWNISFKAVIAIIILPVLAFFYGLKTDSSASIWCHYTSFTAFVSILIYLLYKFKIYNILK
jgi:hypothetical protein